MNVRYAEFAPGPVLAAHVHCLWTFEGEEAGEQRIAPDGRPELIVHYGAPYLENGVRQPPVVFAGQLTRPLTLHSQGWVGVIGVRFKPVGAFAYLGRPLSEATDRRLPLDPGLAVGLAGVSEAERLVRVEAHVAARLTTSPDPEALAAVAALQAGGTVAASRALQRRFAREVGVSPRMLAAVLRFRRVFDALEAGEARSWTEAAQAVGYFDHPQLVRDFRRFLGCTPSRYMKTRGALAAGVASIQDGAAPA